MEEDCGVRHEISQNVGGLVVMQAMSRSCQRSKMRRSRKLSLQVHLEDCERFGGDVRGAEVLLYGEQAAKARVVSAVRSRRVAAGWWQSRRY